MHESEVRITYIGGPTALIEFGGVRLLTDPTFDPAGSEYPTAEYVLRKTIGPAVLAESLLPIDAVLLSHDHHFDNLDHAGRDMLPRAGLVLTTEAGASRLGGNAAGMLPWAHHDIERPNGGTLRVTATPAQHGPAGADRGPVIGFALTLDDENRTVWVSGDTVWFDGVREASERFDVRVALLFCGAARVRVAGDNDLTFSANGAVESARTLGDALIVPVHYEGWEHFTQSREEVERAFEGAGLSERLRWPPAGVPTNMAQ